LTYCTAHRTARPRWMQEQRLVLPLRHLRAPRSLLKLSRRNCEHQAVSRPTPGGGPDRRAACPGPPTAPASPGACETARSTVVILVHPKRRRSGRRRTTPPGPMGAPFRFAAKGPLCALPEFPGRSRPARRIRRMPPAHHRRELLARPPRDYRKRNTRTRLPCNQKSLDQPRCLNKLHRT